MSEWKDSAERNQLRHKRRVYTFIARLDKDIRRLQWFGFLDLCAGILNAGLAVQGFVWAWANDAPWRAGLSVLSLAASWLCFWAARKMRRRARALQALRASTAGILASKTATQLEHYADQGDAALRDLMDTR